MINKVLSLSLFEKVRRGVANQHNELNEFEVVCVALHAIQTIFNQSILLHEKLWVSEPIGRLFPDDVLSKCGLSVRKIRKIRKKERLIFKHWAGSLSHTTSQVEYQRRKKEHRKALLPLLALLPGLDKSDVSRIYRHYFLITKSERAYNIRLSEWRRCYNREVIEIEKQAKKNPSICVISALLPELFSRGSPEFIQCGVSLCGKYLYPAFVTLYPVQLQLTLQ